ncbi:MAG TPA: DUF1674 domain-containing protein [Hyphomicrobiaceae bacterium]|nr:DUF1674 domain-containing protein [Hyphomicrobiaceae bacterium]
MPDDPADGNNDVDASSPPRVLSEAAKRALAEAEERRKRAGIGTGEGRPAELGGQPGPDPTRYGDWEKGGIASDF